MAKCIAMWHGNDSSGRQVEVALSIENVYFYRVYEFNGYQNAWSKWCLLDESEIVHPTKYRNVYDDKVYYYNDDHSPYFKIIEWGFWNLKGDYVEGCRYRLPNL